jgi:hypothetical protein
MPNKDVASLMGPIVKLGQNAGYEVVKNYDLGAGPIDVTWVLPQAGSHRKVPHYLM